VPKLKAHIQHRNAEWFTSTMERIDWTAHSQAINQRTILCREQSTIGWRQLFNGCMSNEWAYLQGTYLLKQHQHQGKDDGLNWTTAIIS
jgi:hypothetical protein